MSRRDQMMRATLSTLAPRQTDQVVVLADCSGSMNEPDAGDGRARIEILRDALAELPANAQILGFNDAIFPVSSPSDLPQPSGSTALDLAIRAAAKLTPIRTIIVSDGEPNSQESARKALEKLDGVVDVVYCGPAQNEAARVFLESLAQKGMGRYFETGDQLDVSKQMGSVMKGLLGTGGKP